MVLVFVPFDRRNRSCFVSRWLEGTVVWDLVTPSILVAVAVLQVIKLRNIWKALAGLQYGPKYCRFDITQEVAKLHEKKEDVERGSRHRLALGKPGGKPLGNSKLWMDNHGFEPSVESRNGVDVNK